ncbi:MAG: hypothetical protein WDM92_16400 [Caulobacteraceae bacterium]
MFEPTDTETQPMAHVAIHAGDLVAADGDPQRLFSVILVRDDRCWVRDLQTGLDGLASVSRCRRIGHEAGAALGG